MGSRVQPTKYTLVVEFETSLEPKIGALTPELITAIRALIAEVGVTEGAVDQVYLTHRPRWRTGA